MTTCPVKERVRERDGYERRIGNQVEMVGKGDNLE